MESQKYDVVVIGCKMAGLAAGLRAAEVTQSVAVLEEAPEKRRGGHTQFAESFRIPTADIDLDVEFNVEDYSASDFYSDIMKVTHYQSDSDLAETVTDNTAAMFEWFTEHGLEWGYRAPHPGYTAGRVWLDGEAFVEDFNENPRSAGDRHLLRRRSASTQAGR